MLNLGGGFRPQPAFSGLQAEGQHCPAVGQSAFELRLLTHALLVVSWEWFACSAFTREASEGLFLGMAMGMF